MSVIDVSVYTYNNDSCFQVSVLAWTEEEEVEEEVEAEEGLVTAEDEEDSGEDSGEEEVRLETCRSYHHIVDVILKRQDDNLKQLKVFLFRYLLII